VPANWRSTVRGECRTGNARRGGRRQRADRQPKRRRLTRCSLPADKASSTSKSAAAQVSVIEPQVVRGRLSWQCGTQDRPPRF